jgi:hypothetical protein
VCGQLSTEAARARVVGITFLSLPGGHRRDHVASRSRLRFEDGRMYLLRVVVAEDEQPPVIITAYRTSKIEKYWSAE